MLGNLGKLEKLEFDDIKLPNYWYLEVSRAICRDILCKFRPNSNIIKTNF